MNHLLIAAALAAAFSPIPSATRAPSGLEFGIGERLPDPSLIGASTNGAPRALTVVSYRGAVARVSPSVVTVHSAHATKGSKGSAPSRGERPRAPGS